MEIEELPLPGCLLIRPDAHGDERGFFLELYRESRYCGLGLDVRFTQDNFSRSRQGTLRGLHYQLTKPQGKLVQVVRGEVFDVAVDLRRQSPTFGQSIAVRLTAEGHEQFYVPPGCAHGFYVVSETADFLYKCTADYDAADERVLLWNDPDLKINWPLSGEPIVSPKDQQGIPLFDADVYP